MTTPEDSQTENVEAEPENIEEYRKATYTESAAILRQVGTRVFLSLIAILLIWLVGRLIFVPIAGDLTQLLLGYPVAAIISAIIVVALVAIILTVFIDIHRLTAGLAGILAYHFGKVTGEIKTCEIKNYRTALDGILYVIIVTLTYLLFVDYLAAIHPAIPAVLFVIIVIWAIFALWNSARAVANLVGKCTSMMADELDKQATCKGT